VLDAALHTIVTGWWCALYAVCATISTVPYCTVLYGTVLYCTVLYNCQQQQQASNELDVALHTTGTGQQHALCIAALHSC
jgi:hypothetical protein